MGVEFFSTSFLSSLSSSIKMNTPHGLIDEMKMLNCFTYSSNRGYTLTWRHAIPLIKAISGLYHYNFGLLSIGEDKYSSHSIKMKLFFSEISSVSFIFF